MTISLDRYSRFDRLGFESIDGSILRITLSTPGRLNAVDHVMHTQLAAVWREVDVDADVAVAVVRGAGEGFSSGGDLNLVEDIASDFKTRARLFREARELVYGVIDCSKPIVSAIHGPAVGAGLAVGLLADVSIAARSARIIDGHTRLGVVAGDHAAIIWPLLCGLAKAKYYLLMCEPISGEEAERIGLVSMCVDDEELEAASLRVAGKLARGSKTAIRWTKHALNNWLRAAGPVFETSLAMEFLGFTGPDVAEGVASLRAKRGPRFEGPGSE